MISNMWFHGVFYFFIFFDALIVTRFTCLCNVINIARLTYLYNFVFFFLLSALNQVFSLTVKDLDVYSVFYCVALNSYKYTNV